MFSVSKLKFIRQKIHMCSICIYFNANKINAVVEKYRMSNLPLVVTFKEIFIGRI